MTSLRRAKRSRAAFRKPSRTSASKSRKKAKPPAEKPSRPTRQGWSGLVVYQDGTVEFERVVDHVTHYALDGEPEQVSRVDLDLALLVPLDDDLRKAWDWVPKLGLDVSAASRDHFWSRARKRGNTVKG